MGLLVEGKWQDRWYDTDSSGGRFKRQDSQFRDVISADGQSGFKAESDRYHLYVSLACPWAHRTLIFRKLKRLEAVISTSVVHWHMGEQGWQFAEGPGTSADPNIGADYLHQIYGAAQPDYSGRVTVPVLWDKQSGRIVNNESAEIIRLLNSAFGEWSGDTPDYYPQALREDIDAVNQRVYSDINNGVYKAGFATTQGAYDEAVSRLFETLDWLEDRLAQQRYLVGSQITEADWRLFTTLIRFDPVYHGHFKCNRRRLVDYANLWGYLRELYQYPGIAETVNFEHITKHYYGSHKTINPAGIVPIGPKFDYGAPHNREQIGA